MLISLTSSVILFIILLFHIFSLFHCIAPPLSPSLSFLDLFHRSRSCAPKRILQLRRTSRELSRKAPSLSRTQSVLFLPSLASFVFFFVLFSSFSGPLEPIGQVRCAFLPACSFSVTIFAPDFVLHFAYISIHIFSFQFDILSFAILVVDLFQLLFYSSVCFIVVFWKSLSFLHYTSALFLSRTFSINFFLCTFWWLPSKLIKFLVSNCFVFQWQSNVFSGIYFWSSSQTKEGLISLF